MKGKKSLYLLRLTVVLIGFCSGAVVAQTPNPDPGRINVINPLKIEVTPAGFDPIDPVNVQWALDEVGSGGTVLLKAGTFNFGFGAVMDQFSTTVTRRQVLIEKSVTLRGELGKKGTYLTKIFGGQSLPAPLANPAHVEAPIGHHGHGVVQIVPTGEGPYEITVRDLWFEEPAGAGIGVLKSPNVNDEIRIVKNKVTDAVGFFLGGGFRGVAINGFVVIQSASPENEMLGDLTFQDNQVIRSNTAADFFYALFIIRPRNKTLNIIGNTLETEGKGTNLFRVGFEAPVLLSGLLSGGSMGAVNISDNTLVSRAKTILIQFNTAQSVNISRNKLFSDQTTHEELHNGVLFRRSSGPITFQHNELTMTDHGKFGVVADETHDVVISQNKLNVENLSSLPDCSESCGGAAIGGVSINGGTWVNNRLSGDGVFAMLFDGSANSVTAAKNKMQQFTPSSVHIRLESGTSNNTVVVTANTTVSDEGTNNTIVGAP